MGFVKLAIGLMRLMESFNFVFIMKMFFFHITNELSLMLQRKDQNIVQAMSQLIDVKKHVEMVNVSNDGQEPLLEEIKSFCE